MLRRTVVLATLGFWAFLALGAFSNPGCGEEDAVEDFQA